MTIRFFTPFYTSNANYPFPYPINSIVKNIVNFSEFVISEPISSTFQIFTFSPKSISYEKFFGDYSLQSDDSLQISKSPYSTLEIIALLACWLIFYAALHIDRNPIRAGIAISTLLLPKIYNRFSLPYFSPKIYFQAEALMDEVRGKIFADKDQNPNTLLALYANYLHNNLHEDAKKVLESIHPDCSWWRRSIIMRGALLTQIQFHLQNDNYTEAQKITDSFREDENDYKVNAKILWVRNAISKNRQDAKELSDLILTSPNSTPQSIFEVQYEWVKFYLKNNNPDEAQKWLEAISDKPDILEKITFRQQALLELYRFYLDTNNLGKAEEIASSYHHDTEWGKFVTFERIKFHLCNNDLEKAQSIYDSFAPNCEWRLEIQLEIVLFHIRSKNLQEAQKIYELMNFSHTSVLNNIVFLNTPLDNECRYKMQIANALLKI